MSASSFHVDVAVRIRSILPDEINQTIDQSDNQSINRSINFSISETDGRSSLTVDNPNSTKPGQSVNQSIKQSVKSKHPSQSAKQPNQSINQLVKQAINQSVKQSISQALDQSVKQSINGKTYHGFKCVINQSASNIDVYDTVLSPLIDRVLNGETACCFAYGHTGSGKTHTIVGYEPELGLYRHAINALISSINSPVNQSTNQSINQSINQMVQVRCCELYQGKVYDLLSSNAECFLREDSTGNVHIRSSTEMDENGQVRVRSLKAAYANKSDDVIALVQLALSNRAVGNSSIHSQSSRSHAMIELQIVTPAVLEARESVLEAEAKLVPIGKARDTLYIDIMSRCCHPDPDRQGGWIQDLKLVPDSEHAELEKLQQRVAAAEEVLQQARKAEHAAVKASTSRASQAEQIQYDCPTLVLVDLAGAEYATMTSSKPGSKRGAMPTVRSAQELSEGREINSSLLALKECMRALSSSAVHVPFRNSKLTLLLRRYLRAQAASAVMIATISPSCSQAAATANTLQYAALLTAAK